MSFDVSHKICKAQAHCFELISIIANFLPYCDHNVRAQFLLDIFLGICEGMYSMILGIAKVLSFDLLYFRYRNSEIEDIIFFAVCEYFTEHNILKYKV